MFVSSVPFSIFSGGLHTSEPWIIKQHEWSYYLPNVDGVFLECVDENVTISDSDEVCENDAKYFKGRHDYYCNCTKGWTGKNCDKRSKFFLHLFWFPITPHLKNETSSINSFLNQQLLRPKIWNYCKVCSEKNATSSKIGLK